MKNTIMIFFFLLMQNVSIVFSQEISLSNLIQKQDVLNIDINFKNTSSQDVLLVSSNLDNKHPTDYFIIPEKKNTILTVRRHLFSFPNHVLDANEPCLSLTKVESRTSYKEIFSLDYPVTQSNFFTNTKVNIKNFDSISIRIGFLPYDDFIIKILDLRPFGKCVVGQDEISGGKYKGKTLLDIQNILNSNAVKITD